MHHFSLGIVILMSHSSIRLKLPLRMICDVQLIQLPIIIIIDDVKLLIAH
jgi:hypothetical protein